MALKNFQPLNVENEIFKNSDEPTNIGHLQSKESLFEIKYQLHLPENDFLLRIMN